jgi:hypothetical protein
MKISAFALETDELGLIVGGAWRMDGILFRMFLPVSVLSKAPFVFKFRNDAGRRLCRGFNLIRRQL